MDRSAIVIHVPHASAFIPDSERSAFQCDLDDELLKMTMRHGVQHLEYLDEIALSGTVGTNNNIQFL